MRGETVAALVDGPVYAGYQYAYPHKTAYRRLATPVPLREVWKDEPKDALFLYVHVPFCEMRCGFCNLFTLTGGAPLVAPYLDALRRQADAVASRVGDLALARMAIGGGTPTFLSPEALDALFHLVEQRFGSVAAIPVCVETSPSTATPERLAVLKGHGVSRVSIGIESFRDDEAMSMGRPQSRCTVEAALTAIRAAGIRTLNIDLIYGVAGQTPTSFLESVRAALTWAPEELYLYPLYVRPLTGLGKRAAAVDDREWDARRLAIYRAARDHLLGNGYEQVSMRMFRRPAAADWGPAYQCTTDGMIGLGAGARSYAAHLHYSSEFAVGRAGVRSIVEDYLARDDAGFGAAEYGIRLYEEDRRRRFVLMSLLQTSGLPLAAYAARFGASVFEHLPQLQDLVSIGWAASRGDEFALTAAGLERSDAIGPWLQAPAVKARMSAFAAR